MAFEWTVSKRRLPELAVFGGALLSLAIALPAFLSDVRLTDAHLVRWKSERGEALPATELRLAGHAYAQAADRLPRDPLNWERSALMTMLAAETSGQRGDLGIAQRDLLRAAALAPSRGSVWTRMVYRDFLAGQLDETTFAAWRMSFLTSRLESDEMIIRLWLGLLNWPGLPDDIRASLVAQGRTLWLGGGAARKSVAEAYRALPGSARRRIVHLLPEGEANLRELEAIADRLP